MSERLHAGPCGGGAGLPQAVCIWRCCRGPGQGGAGSPRQRRPCSWPCHRSPSGWVRSASQSLWRVLGIWCPCPTLFLIKNPGKTRLLRAPRSLPRPALLQHLPGNDVSQARHGEAWAVAECSTPSHPLSSLCGTPDRGGRRAEPLAEGPGKLQPPPATPSSSSLRPSWVVLPHGPENASLRL